MKWILCLSVWLTAQVSYADSVVFESAAYGSNAQVGAVCSSANCLAPDTLPNPAQYVGESFSLSSTASITSIDFHKGLFFVEPTTPPVDIPSDITVAFYDASYQLVYSQTFSPSDYVQTEVVPDPSVIYNVQANFTPFTLNAGAYFVYYFGEHLGIPLYGTYGDSVVIVDPSQGYTFDQPFLAFGATAVRLTGNVLTTVPEANSLGMLIAGLGLAGLMRKKAHNASNSDLRI